MNSIIFADISPLAINRTATYYIIQDTLRGIVEGGFSLKCSALGIHVSTDDLIKNNYCLNQKTEHEIILRLQKLLSNKNSCVLGQDSWGDKARAEQGIMFSFDPLFVPFTTKRSRNLSFVHDLTPITRPEWHNPAVSSLYSYAFSFFYNPSVEIISVSNSTTRDLWANLGIPKSRVNTISLYNRFHQKTLLRKKPNKSFLFVGSLEPRKNLERLAKAFERSALVNEGYSLRVVGQDGHNASNIRSVCQSIPGVKLLGRLSDRELVEEYESCMCLIYPSLWEGFGLPALEALDWGIPLILSDSGALPEVGGKYAEYVDPCDVNAIAQGLTRFTKQKNSQIISAKNRKTIHGDKFTKELFIRNIISIILKKKVSL